MKHTLRLVCLSAALAAAAVLGSPLQAHAQPGNSGYAPPPPPAPLQPAARFAQRPYRFGLTFGFDLGLGSMTAESGPIVCDDCDTEPVAIGGSFEIGGMLNPKLALLFHGRAVLRPLDADGINILYNTMGLIAAKYWLTRQLWIKGGIGFATIGITYDDGFVAEDEQLDEGGAGMIAIGYEVLHSRRFAIDLALTATSSVFDGLDDTIDTGLISLGASWF